MRTKTRRLEIDLSPPNEAQRKVEADILAFRALQSSMKKLIQYEVDKAVHKAILKLNRPKQRSKAKAN